MVEVISYYSSLTTGDSIAAIILKQVMQQEGNTLTCFAPEQLAMKFLQLISCRINQQCQYFKKEIADNKYSYEMTLNELRKKIESLLGQNQHIKQLCWQVEQKCQQYEQRLLNSKQNTLKKQIIRQQSKNHMEGLHSYLRNFELKINQLQQQKILLKNYLEDKVKQSLHLQKQMKSLEQQCASLATELADLQSKNVLLAEQVCFKDVMISQLIAKIEQYEYRYSLKTQEFEDVYSEHQCDNKRTLDQQEFCTSRVSQNEMNFERYLDRSIPVNNDKELQMLSSMKESHFQPTNNSKMSMKRSQLPQLSKINPQTHQQIKQALKCQKSPVSTKKSILNASPEVKSISYRSSDFNNRVNVYYSFFLLLTQCEKINHRHFKHISHFDITYLYDHLVKHWPFNKWQRQIRKQLDSKIYKREPSSFLQTFYD